MTVTLKKTITCWNVVLQDKDTETLIGSFVDGPLQRLLMITVVRRMAPTTVNIDGNLDDYFGLADAGLEDGAYAVLLQGEEPTYWMEEE